MLLQKSKLVLFWIVLLSFSAILLPLKLQAETAVSCIDGSGVTVPCNQGYVPITSLEILFANVLNVITILAGFAVLIVLIIGSFQYIIARGDLKAVEGARNRITWGFIGLFFLVAAWLILLFISEFTGLNLTRFCIGLYCA